MSILIIALVIGQDRESLIKKLGDKEFLVRQEAQRKLLEIMDFSFYLEIKDKKESNSEIKERLKILLNNYEIKLLEGYKVDLKGYPKYPFIDSLPMGYEWKKMSKESIVNLYLRYANEVGAIHDNKPNWTNYRVATELWVNERIYMEFQSVITKAKNEKELLLMMTEALKPIQKDIDDLIKGDDESWKKLNEPNPLRVKN